MKYTPYLWVALFWLLPITNSYGQFNNTDKAPDDSVSNKSLPLSYHPRQWQPDFNVIEKKKEGFYLRRAKKLIKNEKITAGLSYAAYGLSIAKRKGVKRKLLAITTQQLYDQAYNVLQTVVKEFGPKTDEYENEKTPFYTYKLLWHYKQFHKLNVLINALPEKMTSIKATPTIAEIGPLEEKLYAYREKAALSYYEAGKHILKNGKNKDDFKRSAAYLHIAGMYVTNFKDAKELYDQAVDKGTSSINFLEAINNTKHLRLKSGYAFDALVKASITSLPGYDQLPFVTILDGKRGGEYSIKLTIANIQSQSVSYPVVNKTFTKRVKTGTTEDGKEIFTEQKASVSIYTKGVRTHAKLVYAIIDNTTKKVLHSSKVGSTYLWETRWAKGNGKTDLIPGSIKRILGKKPDQTPKTVDLYHQTLDRASEQMGRMIYKVFIKPIGKKLNY